MRPMTPPIDPTTDITSYLDEHFPRDAGPLLELCLGSHGYPHGYHHVPMMAQLAGLEGGEGPGIRELRAGYVLYSSYVYLLDAVVDDHLPRPESLLYLTHLLAGGLQGFSAACREAAPEKLAEVEKLVRASISSNASAVCGELGTRVDPMSPAESRDQVIERSNPFLLLYRLVTVIWDRPFRQEIHDLLSDLAFQLQYADDLADWRQDLQRSKWTPTLRELNSRLGHPASEPEAERELYVNGLYERRIAELIGELDRISEDARRHAANRNALFLSMMERHRRRLVPLLETFLEIKVGEGLLPRGTSAAELLADDGHGERLARGEACDPQTVTRIIHRSRPIDQPVLSIPMGDEPNETPVAPA